MDIYISKGTVPVVFAFSSLVLHVKRMPVKIQGHEAKTIKMSESVIIEATGQHYRKLGCHAYVSDFSNIIKVFIGSNFLSIPFAFGQCGLAVGIIGVVFVGTLSGHCCNLLVKAKYQAIKHILHIYLHPNNFSVKAYTKKSRGHRKTKAFGSVLTTDHLLPPELIEQRGDSSQRKAQAVSIQQGLMRSMQYGDLARMCLGYFGVALTNIAILVTQIGFCVNYAIFIATAIHNFFPVYNCVVQLQTNITIASSDCQYLQNSPWQPKTETVSNISRIGNSLSLGSVSANNTASSLWTVARSDSGFHPGNLTSTDHAAHVGIPSLDASFIQKRSPSIQLPRETEGPTKSISPFLSSKLLNSSLDSASPVPNASHPIILDVAASVVFTESTINHPTSQPETLATSTPSVPEHESTVAAQFPVSLNEQDLPVSPSADQPLWSFSWTDSPDLRLLILIPVALFVLLILIRRMRRLGIISLAGNLALAIGSLAVMVSLILEFQISDSWMWADLRGLPVFFGATSSSFEGAGTILSVEASMEGNRNSFAPCVSIVLSLLVVLYSSMAALSYVTFGREVPQVATMNLDAVVWLGVMVNACIMIGILFTFPIMAYPVVQLVEKTLLGKGTWCGQTEEHVEDKALLLSDQHNRTVATDAESAQFQVSPWKRNVVRIILVLIIGLLAVFLRDNFAYVSAFVGAVGSTFLAFILPCFFHLRLGWRHLSLAIKLKDLAIITTGLVFCATGIYSVIRDLAL